ncbi:MAG: hypothetical protein R3D03_08215 [Geminicoccaceae bacterium]
MATRSHRIHVPLSPSQSVTCHKIDGRKLEMKLGHAYDFNNCTAFRAHE